MEESARQFEREQERLLEKVIAESKKAADHADMVAEQVNAVAKKVASVYLLSHFIFNYLTLL